MSDSENPVYCGDTAESVEFSHPDTDSVAKETMGSEEVNFPSVPETSSGDDRPGVVEEIPASTSEAVVSDGKCTGSACCSFVAAMPPCAVEMLYWRKPVLAGSVFASSLGVLLMVNCCGALSVASLFGLCMITVAFVHRAASAVMNKFTGKPLRNPFQSYLDQPLSIPEEQVEEVARHIAKKGTSVLISLRRLFAVEDIPDSLKFGVQLWLAYHLTSTFGVVSLMIIALVAVFSLPKVYELYQVQIDQSVGMMKQQVCAMLEKAKASPYIGAAINHVMPPKDKQA